MEIEWLALGIGFCSGVITGIVSNYYANKFTDMRESREGKADTEERFEK